MSNCGFVDVPSPPWTLELFTSSVESLMKAYTDDGFVQCWSPSRRRKELRRKLVVKSMLFSLVVPISRLSTSHHDRQTYRISRSRSSRCWRGNPSNLRRVEQLCHSKCYNISQKDISIRQRIHSGKKCTGVEEEGGRRRHGGRQFITGVVSFSSLQLL
ncbi:unnamed protein product [Allacma fusca]|uniref:Uncharacterized protein n=1 Tax=Allacma fusca TaxID=39272 RepID=A0A8J2KA39_9HEXA|nr:unnamed protein product [Allacma fusca]